MAILFVGSSQAQIATGDGSGTTQGAALTSYTKGAITKSGTNSLVPTTIEVTGQHPVFWLGVTLSNNDLTWPGLGRHALKILDNQGLAIVQVEANNSETLVFQGWNGASYTTVASQAGAQSTTLRVDIKVDLSLTGGYEVFINGSSIGASALDLSGLTDPINRVQLLGVADNISVTQWGPVIIANEDTRGMIVQEAVATADGIHFTAFSGDYTAINNGTVNTNGAVQGTTAGDTQSYVLEDLDASLSTGYDILAVVVNSRSSKGAGSSLDQLAHIITDGTNTLEGGDITLDTVPQPRISVFTTAPDGGAWTVAKFNAMEFGLRAKSSV